MKEVTECDFQVLDIKSAVASLPLSISHHCLEANYLIMKKLKQLHGEVDMAKN